MTVIVARTYSSADHERVRLGLVDVLPVSTSSPPTLTDLPPADVIWAPGWEHGRYATAIEDLVGAPA